MLEHKSKNLEESCLELIIENSKGMGIVIPQIVADWRKTKETTVTAAAWQKLKKTEELKALMIKNRKALGYSAEDVKKIIDKEFADGMMSAVE